MKWYLKGNPYRVQQKALDAANGRRGFGYFMEMGLGKTATAYNEFIHLLEMDMVDCMVIICPQSLKAVWAEEAGKWDVQFPVHIWPKVGPICAIMAMNYEAIIGKGGYYLENYILDNMRVYLVLDESIHVKNPQAKRTRRMIGLAAQAKFVRILSGAPITKSALDIWGQFRCIGELEGRNQYAFRNRFCVMGGYMGKQIVGVKNKEELHNLIDSNAFRARKKDWTDLPETLNTTRNYELSKTQKIQYNTMLEDLVLHVKEETITAPMVITQMMKLQQISGGFIIDEQGDTNELVGIEKNEKIKLIKEIVDELDSKVIIFAFYKKSISNLAKAFIGTKCALLTGGQKEDTQAAEKLFFNEGEAKVLIAQLTAGKYGHTLLGTEEMPCHTSIFYENNYDLDARVQAEARNHRHGQHYPVTYVDMVGTNLDRKVIDALQRKQNLATSIIDAVRG
jgi:SNF2 family DNA or RNA helicase